MQLSRKYHRKKSIYSDLEPTRAFKDSLYWLSASYGRWTAFWSTTYGV